LASPSDLSAVEAADLARDLARHHRELAVSAASRAEGVAQADAIGAAMGAVAPRRLPQPQARPRWGWRRSVRFAVERRMYNSEYLQLYARFLAQRLRHPHIDFGGMVFLGPRVELYARRHHGRLALGPWCWLGPGNRLRCHEGNLRLGPKVVLGSNNVVNAYLDVEIGRNALLGDWIYVCDFDHNYDRVDIPVKKQGLVKTPVRIGEDVWVGEKVSILRGADIGAGSVIGSQSLVRGMIPPFSIVVGSPGRVVRSRLPAGMTCEEALTLQRGGESIPGDPLDG
jgi:acetyltransferase-like isoleucine patch superfamily enzyme